MQKSPLNPANRADLLFVENIILGIGGDALRVFTDKELQIFRARWIERFAEAEMPRHHIPKAMDRARRNRPGHFRTQPLTIDEIIEAWRDLRDEAYRKYLTDIRAHYSNLDEMRAPEGWRSPRYCDECAENRGYIFIPYLFNPAKRYWPHCMECFGRGCEQCNNYGHSEPFGPFVSYDQIECKEPECAKNRDHEEWLRRKAMSY